MWAFTGANKAGGGVGRVGNESLPPLPSQDFSKGPSSPSSVKGPQGPALSCPALTPHSGQVCLHTRVSVHGEPIKHGSAKSFLGSEGWYKLSCQIFPGDKAGIFAFDFLGSELCGPCKQQVWGPSETSGVHSTKHSHFFYSYHRQQKPLTSVLGPNPWFSCRGSLQACSLALKLHPHFFLQTRLSTAVVSFGRDGQCWSQWGLVSLDIHQHFVFLVFP